MSRHRIKILRAYVLATIASVILIHAGDAFGILDIQQVSLFTTKHWRAGVLETNPYEFWGMVHGDDITSVTLTTPGGTVIDLVESMGLWELDLGTRYETLGDLRVDFPIGNYTFSFNGEEDSVTVYSDPVEPTGFANVTYPNDGSTNVPLNPTFTWEQYTGSGDNLYMDVGDEEGTLFIQAPSNNINQTSWTPGPLAPGHLHSFEIAVQTINTITLTTTLGYNLTYLDCFENNNEILFTTIGGTPEMMLAELALLILDEVDSGNIAPELERSLLVKVDAALAALDRGNKNDAKVAMNDLKALINQVEAQIDKKITPEVAAVIIKRANAIVATLGG